MIPRLLLATATCFAIGCFPLIGTADDDLIPDSVWYDADQQSLIPIPVRPSVDDSPNRDSRWLPKPKGVTKSSAAPTNTGGGNSASGIGQAFGWVLLSAIAILLIVLIVYAIRNSEASLFKPLGAVARDEGPDNATRERMKELPAELQDHTGDLRFEAERLMNAGQFDRAIVYLYGHQLLTLDRHAWLRLSRGKTNHRYVREVRQKSTDLAGLLNQTVDAFERSYFGRHGITQREFQVLWQQNKQLERVAERESEVAA